MNIECNAYHAEGVCPRWNGFIDIPQWAATTFPLAQEIYEPLIYEWRSQWGGNRPSDNGFWFSRDALTAEWKRLLAICCITESVFDPYAVYHRLLPYQWYLQTAHWKRVREAKLQEECYRCRFCASRATEVHHNCYLHVGMESSECLAAVCRSHHESLHYVQGPVRIGSFKNPDAEIQKLTAIMQNCSCVRCAAFQKRLHLMDAMWGNRDWMYDTRISFQPPEPPCFVCGQITEYNAAGDAPMQNWFKCPECGNQQLFGVGVQVPECIGQVEWGQG